MHSISSMRLTRILTTLIPLAILMGCGEGDGKPSIAGTPAPPSPPPPPASCNDFVGFEDVCSAVTFAEFEGGVAVVVDNPDATGINTSAKVAQMQKFGATSGLLFGGTTMALPTAFNVTAGSSFTMKVWSQRSVAVLFQPEPQGPGSGIEVTHGGTGWEELTFSLPAISGTVSGITIIFDNGTLGDAANDALNWTFYVDEITLIPPGTGGGGGGTFSTITFDDSATTYTLTGFGGAEDSSVQADPAGGTNQVVQVNRAAGAEVFAGTTVSTEANAAVPAIPLDAANTQMTVRVYSPAAGVPVRLKIEDASDSTISVETEATTTTGGAWETLTFDFANEVSGTAAFNAAATYNKVTIFFNFGAAGAPAETYFFDDIDVGTGGGGGGGSFAPITFDDAAITYTLTGFGGAEDATVAADPAGGSNMVGRVVKSGTAELWAGTTVSTGANESISTIPLDAASTQMTVRVYSPVAGIPVRLKIEDASDPTITVETEAMTTVANTWETLTFDFANEVSGTAAFNAAATYNKVSIFFNFGTDGASGGGGTFFFDDIDVGTGGGGGGGGFAPITFDDAGTTYTLTGFGGAEDATVAADPAGGSNMVGRVVKSGTAELWAGTTVSTGANESIATIPLDAASTQMTVRVYSPVAGIPVRLKIEDASDPTITVETEAMTTVANTWETLTFDFANEVSGTAAFNAAATYNKVSIFFNFGTDGASGGGGTFFFDDIDVGTGGGGGGGGFAPITFDDAGTTYTLTGFGGAEDATVQADPAGGTNQVVRVVKSATAELWAGTTVSTEANEAIPTIPLDAANTEMTVRVYSPVAGIPVRLKIEDASDPTLTVETEAMTTGVNTWETLTFDFANEAAGTAAFNAATTYNKASIFFNFGTDGASGGGGTFFFDDIDVGSGGGGGGGGSAPTSTDFEGAGPFNFSDFDGGAATIVANPDASGINTSATVGQMQKFAGQPWGGSTLDLGGAVDWSAGEVYTMKVRSPRVVDVLLKLEGLNQERTATHGGTGWEELCFDFTGTTGGAPATAITLIFDNGTMGDAAGDPANWTFEFDDIDQVASCPGGGGGGAFAPITFDDAAVTYTLTDFGGNASVVTNDPAGGTNMVAQAIKSDTAELWAGTTVSTEANQAIPTIPLDAANTRMSVRVYSPDAGIPVRLKVEDASNNTITVETEAMTTGVNTWETLEFDFANPAAGTAAFNEANTYNKVSIFFNFGTTGATAGEKTYFFDDIDVVAGGGGGGSAPTSADFEGAGPSTFSDFDGGAATVIANPDVSGINTSAMVGQMQKFAGQPWGGSTLDLGGAVDWSAGEVFTMKVRSSRVVPVLFKLEGLNQERSVDHGGSGTWEELCFDFTGATAGAPATAITFIFDNGIMGDATGDPANWTFEFDDVQQAASCPGGGGAGAAFVNGDFETGDFTGWTQFQDPPGGGGSISLDTSVQGGRAGTVARLVAAGSDVVGTNDVIIGQVALAAGTVMPGDSIDVSFDLFGSLTGAGGVVFVEVIFLDAAGSDNGRNFVGPAAPYTPTGTWTTQSGTVTAGTMVGGGSASVAGGVTLELKVACGAIAGGCGVDASFDNVTFTIN